MSLEDYRSHEMRAEVKLEMDKLENALKDPMYKAIVQVKEDLEHQVDQLKKDNDNLL